MKVRYLLLGLIAFVGVINGAFGNRFAADAGDIQNWSDFPIADMLLSVPAFLFIFWLGIKVFRTYSPLVGYAFFGLGCYALAYGVGEIAFHSLNHKPWLSSLSILLLGAIVSGDLLLARRLWWDRRSEA
jgi:hypothetical protein